MELNLPDTVASKRDLIQLQRMIEVYQDGSLQQRVSLDKAGVMRQAPALPKPVETFMNHNRLEINDGNLTAAHQGLSQIKESARVVRISFASEPNDDVVRKIIGWFRREVDQKLLIQVGVQPSIAGGCVVQTGPNRYDFSLRRQLLSSVPKFLEVMRRG